MNECETSANEHGGFGQVFHRTMMEGGGTVVFRVSDPRAFLVMGLAKDDRAAAWRAALGVADLLLAIGGWGVVILRFSEPTSECTAGSNRTSSGASTRAGSSAARGRDLLMATCMALFHDNKPHL